MDNKINILNNIFHIIFSSYLIIHFYQLIPYADEIFGNNIPYDYTLLNIRFLNALNILDATIFVIILLIISIIYLFSKSKICSLILLYGWYCLFNANIYISNPGIPYVGWLLLATSFTNIKRNRVIFIIAWFLLTLGYTISGIHKLHSPSWLDGSAIYDIVNGQLSRNNIITDFIKILHPIIIQFMTYSTLFLEISSVFIGTFYYTRKIYWIMYILFHIGILLTINFSDLTLGMLMIHFYVMPFIFTDIRIPINYFIV